MGQWFANPVMLAGLGAMLLPLLVHMTSRLWYRRVAWGAMMFLPTARPGVQWKIRLRQWGVIGVRMGIIGCLCLAMARPSWRGGGPDDGSRGLTVLVVDRSGSMALDEQGRSRAELAQEAALAVLSSLPAGQQVSLVFAGDDPGETQPSSDLQAVASRLAQKIDTFSTADMARSLELAADILEQHGQGHRDLYVITDQQAINWRSVTPTMIRNWQQLHPVNSDDGRFVVITLGTHQPENSSVDQVRLVNEPAVIGLPVEVEIRLGNHGPGARTAVPLVIYSGKTLLHQQLVNLSPESQTTIRATVTLPGNSEQVLRAELGHDRLPADDSMERVVTPHPPLDVLLVCEVGNPDDGKTERDFVPAALSPFTQSGRQGADLGRVRIATPDSLVVGGLDQYAAVILANVADLSWPQVQAIEQYAYNGGGVLIAPGSRTNLQNLNSRLWRQGAGICPAKLLPPTAADGSQATGMMRPAGAWELPGFVLRNNWDLPLQAVGRYFPTESIASQARSVIRYRDGTPYLLAQQTGRGRVMLLTSPLDADWNLLPASQFYLELLQSSLRWISGGNLLDANLQLGQEWVQEVDPAVLGAEVFGPMGWRPIVARIWRAGSRVEIRTGPIRPAGSYRLRIRTPSGSRWLQLIVQPDRTESDLRDLDPARWDALSGQLGFTRVRLGIDPLDEVLSHPQDVTELWIPLLALAMGLVVVEMWLTSHLDSSSHASGWRWVIARLRRMVNRSEPEDHFPGAPATASHEPIPQNSPAPWEIAASQEDRW